MSFESLNVGDRVIVDSGHGRGLCLRKVDRVTKTQIIIGNNKYRRSDGNLIGGGAWCRVSLQMPTPELLEDAFRQTAVATLRNFKFDGLSTEKLKAVLAIVNE